jgi:hypothetical protein
MRITGGVRSVISTFVSVTIGISGLYGMYMYDVHTKNKIEERKNTVCPSFLSIARSSRDTLLVMRNDPLCNRYVLENLK